MNVYALAYANVYVQIHVAQKHMHICTGISDKMYVGMYVCMYVCM